MILPPQCCWAGCRGATGEDSLVQGTRSRRSEHRFLSQYRYTASYSVSAPPARRRLAHPGPQTFSQVLTGNFYTIHHCIYKLYNILLRRFSEPMLMLVCYPTRCCKTSVKLWKHITETLYRVFCVFLGSIDCQI